MRIRTAYAAVGGRELPIGENPVKKVPLVVTGYDGVVNMDELGGEGGVNDQGLRLGDSSEDKLMAIYSKIDGVTRRQAQAEAQTQLYHSRTDRKLENMDKNLRRIARQPVQRVLHVDTAGGGGVVEQEQAQEGASIASLSPRPRDLHLLWLEYEFGLGGRKPARQFTAMERGKVKFKYSRRKVVWDTIDRLIRCGYTAQVAIDRIYVVYGQTSVTHIIDRMRRDAIGGGHAALR